MRDTYYKNGKGFILVFSVGVSSSLKEIRHHFEEIQKATVSWCNKKAVPKRAQKDALKN